VVDGRSEWGPRALGHRSLLAPAGPVSVRERLHRAVKEREPFRPFAPAAGASVAAARFDGVSPSLARFMTGVARARDPHDPALGAVVHVDGTARLQLVEDDASLLARVLALVPGGVVLNTSLNAAGEPLCESALDAIAFFQDRPIDALVIGDVIVRRPGAVS
jgi:carbamoyltransferase